MKYSQAPDFFDDWPAAAVDQEFLYAAKIADEGAGLLTAAGFKTALAEVLSQLFGR